MIHGTEISAVPSGANNNDDYSVFFVVVLFFLLRLHWNLFSKMTNCAVVGWQN